METHDRKVIDVLGDQKRFIVPFYQRHYKWGETLWQSFWEDVLAKAEEALERRPKFDHYMGALILAPESYSVAVTPRLQIVDGQQRLTTFQLFLAALREAANKLGHPQIEEAVHNYLFNRPMSGDVGDDVQFKLAPNRADRATFYKLINSGLTAVRNDHPDWFFKYGRVIKKYAPNTVQAVYFFEEKIRSFAEIGTADNISEDEDFLVEEAKDEPQTQNVRLQSLLTALLNHLKLVVITLGENDDAQVIFETLNSKSEPLTAMELVRNNIFQRAARESEKAEALFEARWKPLEGRFWQEVAPRARPRRPRVDHFLSHALTAQTGEEVSLRELYAEYRAFARPKGAPRFETLEDELNALLRYAPIYQALEGDTKDQDLNWLGDKLMLWEITTVYPVVFTVASSEIDQTEKRLIFELINSYLVRRGVCGLTPKNLNKNFQRLTARFLTDGVSVNNLARFFSDSKGSSTRYPTDQEINIAFKNTPVYQIFHRKDRLREILWNLECATRTKFSVNVQQPEFISVEHIMPQSWKTHWPLPNGKEVDRWDLIQNPTAYDEDTHALVSTRDRLIHTIGNLTLVTVPANAAASNAAFDDKKALLNKSLLAINAEVIEQTTWSEEDIILRSEKLADLATNVWPALPEPIS